MHELAMHQEHRRRDPLAALATVERALDLLDPRNDSRSQRLAAAFWHRRERLLRKRGAGRRQAS
jgi:hypothetical protein